MEGGGDEVAGEAGGLALAFDEDGLHIGGVAGVNAGADAGEDFGVAAEEGHLAATD